MIEKMKYINLMGPMSGIDHAIKNYIAKYEIQLEYTLKELTNEKGLTPISEENPYTSLLKATERFWPLLEGHVPQEVPDIADEDAEVVLQAAAEYFDEVMSRLKELEAKNEQYRKTAKQLEFFTGMDLDIELLDKFEYFSYEFGRMPYASYKQFQSFLYKDAEVILDLAGSDKEFLYCSYYCPKSMKDKIDSIFSSLHFERIEMPRELDGKKLTGSPRKNYDEIMEKIEKLSGEITSVKEKNDEADEIGPARQLKLSQIVAAIDKLKELAQQFEYRKYAAKTPNTTPPMMTL